MFSNLTGLEQVSTDPGLPTSQLVLQNPDVTDNAGLVTVTADYPIIYEFPIGDTNVIFTAVDRYGNVATAILTVRVTGM